VTAEASAAAEMFAFEVVLELYAWWVVLEVVAVFAFDS